MFRQLNLNNERGLVFIVIMMVVIVMITLTLSLISINISQVNLTEKEAKRIQADLIGPAMLSLAFTRIQANLPGNTFNQSVVIDGVTYNSQFRVLGPGTGPLGTSLLNGTVNF